jgi:signal transduction histidine kinase
MGEIIRYESGICDIPAELFKKGPVKVAADNIEYYPEQYLTPQEITESAPEPFSVTQYGTMRLVFNLPDNEPYAITFAVPGLAGKVFINGEAVWETGKLGESPEEIQMGYEWCALNAEPINGKIELVIQAANFLYAHFSVFLPEINIAPARIMGTEDYLFNKDSAIIMGILFGAAVLIVGIWAFYPQLTPQTLWFALICLVMSARAGLTGYSLQWFLPDLTSETARRMLFTTPSLLVLLVYQYLERAFPVKFGFYKYVSQAVTALSIPFMIFGPFYAVTYTFGIYYALAVSTILYAAVCLIRITKKLSSEQSLAFTGIAIFFISALVDLAMYINLNDPWEDWLPNVTFSEIGLAFFTITQIITLFVQNIRTTASAVKEKNELAERNELLERMDRMKTEFWSNVSHELKTPLTVITGYAQTAGMRLQAKAGLEKDEDLVDRMKLIASESERLGLYVSQVLTASRIDEGQLRLTITPCEVSELVHSAIETYFPILNKNRNRLEVYTDPDLPIIMADPHRLSQVLVNLISNAVRHTVNGVISVTAVPEGGMVRFIVKDNGKGILPEIMPYIFDRYAAGGKRLDTLETGTGLGLFICKRIVEEHGGTITAVSDDTGTEVNFTIPAAYRAAPVMIK